MALRAFAGGLLRAACTAVSAGGIGTVDLGLSLKLRRFAKRTLLSATLSLSASMTVANAHTVSIGYEALGGGVFDIWYGSYHTGVNFTEGSLQFVGPSVSTTVAFTMLVNTKPSGLIDGTTNFYSNATGTGLTGTPVPLSGPANNGGTFNGQASSVDVWQGVQFTGIIRPGTYTFTYIPIANPTQEWDPINNAILTGTFTISAKTLGTTYTGLLPPGSSSNVTNLAAALDNFANNGTLPAAFQNLYDLPGPQLAAALGELSGETSADSAKGAFQLMNEFLGLMLDPFVDGRGGCGGGLGAIFDPSRERDCGDRQARGFAPDQQASFPPDIALAYASVLKTPPPFTPRWTSWGAGFGGAATTVGNLGSGTNNVIARDFGFAGGMDYHATPDTLYGFALGGGGTSWSLGGLGSGRSDAFQAGVYSKSYFGPAYLAAALAFTNNWMTTDRTALGDEITARFNGQSYGGRVEAGYRYTIPTGGGNNGVPPSTMGATPYAALQTQWFHTPTYSETDLAGGGLGLTYNATTVNDTRSELGFRFDNPTMLEAMPLVLRGRLAWAHDWATNPALDAVFESLPGTNFVVNGAKLPPNSALATAGAELHMDPAWSLLVKFDGDFAPGGSNTYSGSATLRYRW